LTLVATSSRLANGPSTQKCTDDENVSFETLRTVKLTSTSPASGLLDQV
jgi:hypothetical protein